MPCVSFNLYNLVFVKRLQAVYLSLHTICTPPAEEEKGTLDGEKTSVTSLTDTASFYLHVYPKHLGF